MTWPVKIYRTAQSAHGAFNRQHRFITPNPHHQSCPIKNSELAAIFLRQESDQMHSRARFGLAEDHRFGQLSAAQRKSVWDGSKFEHLHFSS
jgi:hypothetical protein